MFKKSHLNEDGNLLPQSYLWANSLSTPDGLKEVIALSAFDAACYDPHNPIDAQKLRIADMARAFARDITCSYNPEDIALVQLPTSKSRVGRMKSDSGFSVVDMQKVNEGRGYEAELVTVYFVRPKGRRDTVVPLVFAHQGSEDAGVYLKRSIDQRCAEIHGASAQDLIRDRSHTSFARLFRKSRTAISAAVAVASAAAVMGAGVPIFMHYTPASPKSPAPAWTKHEHASIVKLASYAEDLKKLKNGEGASRILSGIRSADYWDMLVYSQDLDASQRRELAQVCRTIMHHEMLSPRKYPCYQFRTHTEHRRRRLQRDYDYTSWEVKQLELQERLDDWLEAERDESVRKVLKLARAEVTGAKSPMGAKKDPP